MKKSVKLTALILVAVLITATFAATTLAYYKTQIYSGTQSATIANWGFEKKAAATWNLFSASYTREGKEIISSGNAGDSILAPGASGTQIITIESPEGGIRPQVNYKVNVVLDINAGFSDLLDRLTFSIKDENNEIDSNGISAKELKSVVAASYSKEYAANTECDFAGATFTIGWEWDEGNDVLNEGESSDAKLQKDATSANNITFKLTVSAEQIFKGVIDRDGE